LEVMLLMTKYSNEVSFIALVNIQIKLNNFKCRRFFGTPFNKKQKLLRERKREMKKGCQPGIGYDASSG